MSQAICQVAANRQPILRELGLDAQTIFTHPSIRVWRTLPDRENATLDATLADGQRLRLHVKRYPASKSKGGATPAQIEAQGIQLLTQANIPTVPLLAWGHDELGRSFLITEDLKNRQPADKLMEEGLRFETLLESTACLAADLHGANLHHRDLYLCHFFVNPQRPEDRPVLIDAARVRRIPRLLPKRWIIKDLAQFHYSAIQRQAPVEQLRQWLDVYARRRRLTKDVEGMWRQIQRKSAWIARHDARLNRRQPRRNVSISDQN